MNLSGKRKKLSEIVAALGMSPEECRAFRDVEITGVECRPAMVRPGDLFCCIDEFLEYNQWRQGRAHVDLALERGAVAVLAAQPLENRERPHVVVSDAREALGLAARVFHEAPDRDIGIVGVTGTNGKTTTTRLIAHVLRTALGRCASMGTLGMEVGGETIDPGEYTTPLAHVNYQRLARLREEGVKFAAMEVSSHALELNRVAGIRFAGAVLTNFSRDHLDFHGNIEAYAAAKKRLFARLDQDGFAVINSDTDRFDYFRDGLNAAVITCGVDGEADWTAGDIETGASGARFVAGWRGRKYRVESRLVGRFQVYNILGALAAATALGVSPEAAAAAVADFPPAPGRMEAYPLPNGATAIIDFAHNPDGLNHVLQNCRALRPRRLLIVFGCGGDRDLGKRPMMGRIASEHADECWLTSDNPRTEDPDAIIADIRKGCSNPERLHVQPDRAVAIREAYAITRAGDVLVIAGKGHETCQLVGTTKVPYSDRGEVLRLKRPAPQVGA